MNFFSSRLLKHQGSAIGLGLIAGLSLQTLSAQAAPKGAYDWVIQKDTWSETDERNYEDFVQALGRAKCRRIDDCLKNPANPYRSSDPADSKFFADCADLPYFLRAYFAWKNHLPFSYVSAVTAAQTTGGGSRDIRYTKFGNKVVKRADVTIKVKNKFPNALQVLNGIGNTVSSAMFRFHPDRDDPKLFTDHYSVKIDRKSIRPGTIIYDPNGHVAVVYDVLADGRVMFMDAHPDNSLTRGTYGQKFARANPGMGAGFKQWRPIRLVGYVKDASQQLIGGKVVSLTNTALKEKFDYSNQQFFGTEPVSSNATERDANWRKGKFVWEGVAVSFYDYVRQALAIGKLQFEPVEEFRNMLAALCDDIRDRVSAVELAIGGGIHSKPHPAKLPINIYGTSGEWEVYSSPSRDARLKTSFKEVRDRVQEFVEKSQTGDSSIQYLGNDLRGDLLQVFAEQNQACSITYKKSDGQEIELRLKEIMDRLFALSFDPYHCSERRWGASSAAELASCSDQGNKALWYEREQYLRNQIERTYDLRMDFSLDQLTTPEKGNGVRVAPDVDVLRYLESLPAPVVVVEQPPMPEPLAPVPNSGESSGGGPVEVAPAPVVPVIPIEPLAPVSPPVESGTPVVGAE